MNTDPIADMLTRIRNAVGARKPRVDVPSSKLKIGIAEILKSEGFIGEFSEIAGASKGQNVLDIELRYDEHHEPVIQDVQRFSRPGLRRYMSAKDIPKIRNGQGVVVMTTSHGLMTDRDARKSNIGGEALLAIW